MGLTDKKEEKRRLEEVEPENHEDIDSSSNFGDLCERVSKEFPLSREAPVQRRFLRQKRALFGGSAKRRRCPVQTRCCSSLGRMRLLPEMRQAKRRQMRYDEPM